MCDIAPGTGIHPVVAATAIRQQRNENKNEIKWKTYHEMENKMIHGKMWFVVMLNYALLHNGAHKELGRERRRERAERVLHTRKHIVHIR